MQPGAATARRPGATALDAACGTGRHAAFLDSLGAKCAGIDQSARCSRWREPRLPNGRFEQGTLDDMPFADEEFEIAVVSLALCHLGDPTAALGRAVPGSCGAAEPSSSPTRTRRAGSSVARPFTAVCRGPADALGPQPLPLGVDLAAGVPECRPGGGGLRRGAVRRGTDRQPSPPRGSTRRRRSRRSAVSPASGCGSYASHPDDPAGSEPSHAAATEYVPLR